MNIFINELITGAGTPKNHPTPPHSQTTWKNKDRAILWKQNPDPKKAQKGSK